MRRSWLLLLLVGPGCAPTDPTTERETPESGAQETAALTRVIAVADDGTQAETRAVVDRGRLVGRYFTGDLTGYNLQLDLRADGSFGMTWRGCLSVYGTADGSWVVDEQGVALNPVRAEGLLAQRPVGRLQVATLGGHYLLVRESFRDLFDKYGPSHAGCLHQEAAETAVEAAHARALDYLIRGGRRTTRPAEDAVEQHPGGGK